MNRHRVFSISSILILGLVLPALPSGAAIKAGAVCKKAQQVRVVKGDSFTCVKKGKRLVWRKSGVAPVVVPAAEPTPTASPSPTPTVSPTTSPALPSDSLSYKNAMVYSLKGSELIRRADSGEFFETDSRSKVSFSEIRQKAFDAVNVNPRNREHPNIEFVYNVRPTFPNFLLPFVERELDEAAALWNDYFKGKFKVNVFLVTEKDREYIKGNRWLQNNLPGEFDRLENRSSRPYLGGGAGFWQDGGEWRGNIYIAAATCEFSYG